MPHPGRLYPQSLSQSTVLRYYCRYFCCHCACCCPCYPCCCPCYPCYPCFVLADCSAIVFKNEIKMVLPIAETRLSGDVRGTGRGEGVGCGRSWGDLPRPAPCALSVVRKAATKAVKIADYNRGFPHRTQLFIIAAAACPPPSVFSLCLPSFLYTLGFFVSYFGVSYRPPSPAQWPPQWHDDDGCDDVFISFASFISLRCFSSFCFCFFFIFLFLFHTSENICICARLLHVLLLLLSLSPYPSSFLFTFFVSFSPTPSPTLPSPLGVSLCCLLPFALICVLFVLCAVSLCFLFLSPSPSSSSSASPSRYLPPRFSNLLICELLCSHYNSFCFVSLPSPFFSFRWGIQASCLLCGY